MKIKYIERKFSPKRMAIIEHANKIIAEYTSEGYELTLRQLYYQFVSRDLCANTMREYQNLASIISNARLAGLVSWEAIIDRTRNLESNSHWQHPKQFMESVMPQFAIDKWEDQPNRVEVWIEKDALIGVIERICRSLDVAYFSCRGYTSQSEMWSASQRHIEYIQAGQNVRIIHLGDHDPSGKDMTRDIEERIQMFLRHDYDGDNFQVNRIALNMEQVRKFRPPPNPAKITDSRAGRYIAEFGKSSWELDALDPKVLTDLVKKTVLSYRDDKLWRKRVALESEGRERLEAMTERLEDESED
jgi:hypothetical protein